MKKLVGFIILLVAAGGGWWYYVKYGTPPEKATVNKATISRGDIVEAVSATGALEPKRRYDVGSQVSGTVRAIHVDYNDIVKKGQLLAEIDPSLLQVQVDIQTANIERQISDIANQRVQLEDQRKQFERTKSLFEQGLQNQQQFETAELAIKTRVAQIASAEKSLVQARANLDAAKMNVGYTKIIAPADGVVVERRVDVGQAVQASMSTPSFFVLATPLQELKLTAGVDEAEIGKIRTGMEVRFTVDAYGLKPFYGTVENVRLNAANQNNVVTYPVWITVPNPNLELRPSMTANIKIVLSTATDVVRVPLSATRFRPNADTYKGLGLEAPAQGGRLPGAATQETNNGGEGGRGGGRGAQADAGAARSGQTAARGGATPTGPAAQPAGARGARPQGTQPRGDQQLSGRQGSTRQPGQGRSGRGAGSGFADMTPEQQKQFMERVARGGGAGGRGGNRGQNAQTTGRGGQAGARGAQPAATGTAGPDVQSIDELWAPISRPETRGTVWKWDEKQLTSVQLRLGVSDGQFIELVSGDLKVGDEVVTGVTLPASLRPTTNTNPLLGQPQQRGGQGGFPSSGGGGGSSGRGGGGGGRGGN